MQHTNFRVGLVGNPNSGKTTLFNALTGSRQRVGNWPGVTVERKTGHLSIAGDDIELVDLPGVYSLSVYCTDGAVDERIACEYILSGNLDLIINVVDASNLERNLYLTTQLQEMGVPMVIALNMLDVATERGMEIDTAQLSQELGCPVVALQSNRGQGVAELQQQVQTSLQQQSHDLAAHTVPLPKELAAAVSDCANLIAPHLPDAFSVRRQSWLALRTLEGDGLAAKLLGNEVFTRLESALDKIRTKLSEDVDILVADARYGYIATLVKKCLRKRGEKRSLTQIIDKVVLNRVLGIPIFLAIMYVMFLFAINMGGAFQDFFDISSSTLFVGGLSHLFHSMGLPDWFCAIVANGFGTGINTTVTFIPVIGGMFLFLSFLEDSGYMARAAFVMDRFMRALGLPGKSFVPMIVGFGCNVPAIMAARTLENRRDRVLTIMMSPFMSCGARLAIFAVFTAAFFPVGGQNIVFALYVIGILVAVLTGLILRKTLLKGDPAPLIMELPPYHMPTLRALLLHTWFRLKNFLFKAGKVIIPLCILIGALNTINTNGTLSHSNASQHSLLSVVGQAVTPVFAPMGLKQDNWPATVGLVTGVMAKEVVVATLNTLYTQVGHLGHTDGGKFDLWAGLKAAVMSVPQNLSKLGQALGNPVVANEADASVGKGVFGQMYQRFDGKIGAFAYLLFVLLYFPCVSATAAMTRELSRGWTWFSVGWTTGLAYGVAVIFYQLATIMRHPRSSIAWTGGVVLVLAAVLWVLKRLAREPEERTPTNAGIAAGASS